MNDSDPMPVWNVSSQSMAALVRDGQSETALAQWVEAGKPQDGDLLVVVAAAELELGSY